MFLKHRKTTTKDHTGKSSKDHGAGSIYSHEQNGRVFGQTARKTLCLTKRNQLTETIHPLVSLLRTRSQTKPPTHLFYPQVLKLLLIYFLVGAEEPLANCRLLALLVSQNERCQFTIAEISQSLPPTPPPAAVVVVVVLRPSADRDRAAAAAASFLSLKKPNTGREHTGTLSTTGVARTPAE
jgi:hypothetical protein